MTTVKISDKDSKFIKDKFVTLQNFFDKMLEAEKLEEKKRAAMLRDIRGSL